MINRKLNILQIHNEYIIHGGEASVLENEKKLLEKNGHNVVQYIVYSSTINESSLFTKLCLFLSGLYSYNHKKKIELLIQENDIDIIHIHNVFPLISPSVYYVKKKKNVKIVQTLHNYRFQCTNAIFYVNNNICQKCTDKFYFRSIFYKCYKNSRLFSFYYSLILTIFRLSKTFEKKIDKLIVFSEFHKNILIQNGFEEKKIFIKQHNIKVDLLNDVSFEEREGVLYIGRLSREKGLDCFIETAKSLPNVKFFIAGSGELKEFYLDKIKNENIENISYLGFLQEDEKYKALKSSKITIFPSLWNETFGLILIESLSVGTPVIASDLGSIGEIIDPDVGLLFEANNSSILKQKISDLYFNSVDWEIYSKNAIKKVKEFYLENMNYLKLIEIYENE